MSEINIRTVIPNDLDRCFAIETAAYGGEEAASREKIAKRINQYPQGFLVIEWQGQVCGFVNGGATFEVDLADEHFKDLQGHDPAGPNVVIMSVAVHPDAQGQGLASQCLRGFIEAMKVQTKTHIYLICQSSLVSWYESFGFAYLKPSESNHGGLSWHDMVLKLT